jgi:hypothetical protein
MLPCGCLVGVYETYDGRVVASIDARGPSCEDLRHDRNADVPVRSPLVESAAGSRASLAEE